MIFELDIDDVILNERNTQQHTEQSVAAIAKSLKTFGQVTPIVLDKSNVVIKGNGTVMALRKLEKPTVACLRAEHLSEEQLKAYEIADNQTGLITVFDTSVLAQQVESMPDQYLNALGFAEDELDDILSREALGAIDGKDEETEHVEIRIENVLQEHRQLIEDLMNQIVDNAGYESTVGTY